jgi:phosphoglycerol transferase
LLNLWHAHPRIPFVYWGDALSTEVYYKSTIEHGWFSSIPEVGAPWGRHTYDFPFSDNLHMLAANLLLPLTHNFAIVINLYYMVTFPLAAMSAAWCSRVLGLSRLTAAAIGIVYAYAPYHIWRGEPHLFLAAYYPVPLIVVLLFRTLQGEPLWNRRSTTGRWAIARQWLTGRNTANVAIIALLGTASAYYCLIALLFFCLAVLVAAVQSRLTRRVWGVIVAAGVLGFVMLLNLLPHLLYERAHGANPVVPVRTPQQTEVYALKLSSLVLPWTYHRIQALSDFRARYDGTFPLPSESPALGLVGALGLIFLLVVALLAIMQALAPGSRISWSSDFWNKQRMLAGLTVFGFLTATVGGISTLITLLVTDIVRSWNRMDIFLALFTLCSVGLLLERVALRIGSTGRLKNRRLLQIGLAAAVAVVVVGVAVLDQTTSRPTQTKAAVAEWQSDEQFVHAIEARVPHRSIIFQLPFMQYPESAPIHGMLDSEQFRSYLHSKSLRWTYGGVRGRPESDWPATPSSEPVPTMCGMLVAAGIAGIEIDRAGYPANAKAIEASLRTTLRQAPMISPDQRFSFWTLDAYAEEVRARHPLAQLQLIGRHVLLHAVAYPARNVTTSSTISVYVDNPWPNATTTIAATIDSRQHPSRVDVGWPDRAVDTVSLGSGAATVRHTLTLPVGRSVIRIRVAPRANASVPDLSAVRFNVLNVTVPDEVLSGFLP